MVDKMVEMEPAWKYALEAAARIYGDAQDPARAPEALPNDPIRVARALLSASSAERGIAEKGMELIRAINKHDIGKDLRGQAYTDIVGAKNLLADAIHALSPKGGG